MSTRRVLFSIALMAGLTGAHAAWPENGESETAEADAHGEPGGTSAEGVSAWSARQWLAQGAFITDLPLLELLDVYEEVAYEEGTVVAVSQHSGWVQRGHLMVPLRDVVVFRHPKTTIASLADWKGRRCVTVTSPQGSQWHFPISGGPDGWKVLDQTTDHVAIDPPAQNRDGVLYVPLRFLIAEFAIAARLHDADGIAYLHVYRLESDGAITVGYCPMQAVSRPPKAPVSAEARATIIRWLKACIAHDWDTVDRLTADGGSYFVDLVSYVTLGRREWVGGYSLEVRAAWRNRLGMRFSGVQWVTAEWEWDEERWLVTAKD